MEPTRTGPAAAAGAPSSSSPIQLIACGTILRRGPRRRRDRGRYRYDLRRGPRRRLDRRGKIQVPRRGVAATGAAPNAREQEDRGAADLREEEARRFEVFRIVRHSERVAPGRAALGDRRRVLLHASNRVAVEPEVAPAPTRPRRDEALIRSSILVRSARSVALGTSTSRPAAAPRSGPKTARRLVLYRAGDVKPFASRAGDVASKAVAKRDAARPSQCGRERAGRLRGHERRGLPGRARLGMVRHGARARDRRVEVPAGHVARRVPSDPSETRAAGFAALDGWRRPLEGRADNMSARKQRAPIMTLPPNAAAATGGPAA